MKLFRDLSKEEEKEFRQWARDNYEPFSEISGVWHPVVQNECVKINKEKNNENKCTIDNIHPNWKNQELQEDLDRVSQQMFGVDYDNLGIVGRLDVEDKLKNERD